MFASDYPYDMATDAARWIETAPISENDRRKICYDNAAALFDLPPSPTKEPRRGREPELAEEFQTVEVEVVLDD
jgi:Amidohydrolase